MSATAAERVRSGSARPHGGIVVDMSAVRPPWRSVLIVTALMLASLLAGAGTTAIGAVAVPGSASATVDTTAQGAPPAAALTADAAVLAGSGIMLDPEHPGDPLVVAVGDIASATGADDEVADLVAGLGPEALLLLGDIAYPDGSASDFASYFAPDWSRFSEIWMPVPGNHEYRTTRAEGYREFFGIPNGRLYWTRQVGPWRVIGLDSERAGGAKQLAWLRETLQAHLGQPTIVMWHRARYSSGQHGDAPDTDALWDAIKRDRDVRLVLWGHDHNYERMAKPIRGREPLPAMVVGTGGGSLRPTPTLRDRVWRQVFIDQTTGVLALRLGETSFAWQFVNSRGEVLDHGTHEWQRPQASVRVRTLDGATRLHVNVNPNVGDDYWRFTVRRADGDGGWSLVGGYRTRRDAEVRTLDLPRGVYRVRVKPKFGHLGVTAPDVRLVG